MRTSVPNATSKNLTHILLKNHNSRNPSVYPTLSYKDLKISSLCAITQAGTEGTTSYEAITVS